jgi:anaerobic selenocysteine-containing dehydrogenase
MTQRTRTTCPFCRNGCESIVTFDYQYRMEYPADALVNRGRLCPRGNSASIVVDHPRRLAYPLLDGREVGWDRAFAYCREATAGIKPEETAVVYSRGLTLAEVAAVRGFAAALGTANLVCGYVEPDNWFQVRLTGARSATLDDVRQARTTLLIGDVFGTSPVAAGPLTEARYADRKNRMVVIDSLKTRQAGFAHLFLQPRPGGEAFCLLGIAGVLDPGLGVNVAGCAAAAGVEERQLSDVARMLGDGPCFVGSAMHLGRVGQPWQHSLMSQLVAVKAGATFNGFGEARVPFGRLGFAEFRRRTAVREVKTVFWFGGLYPYSYPELMPEAAQVRFSIVSSIFRPEATLPGLVLPVASELEKESVGESYWGEVRRHPVAEPPSGARPVPAILAELAPTKSESVPPAAEVTEAEAVKTTLAALAAFSPAASGFTLVGEKCAIGVGGFYEPEERVSVNPADSARLGLARTDNLLVESVAGKAEFRVRRTEAVPAGVVAIGVNARRNRALFPLAEESASGVAIPPASVSVAAIPAAGRSPAECTARAE